MADGLAEDAIVGDVSRLPVLQLEGVFVSCLRTSLGHCFKVKNTRKSETKTLGTKRLRCCVCFSTVGQTR